MTNPDFSEVLPIINATRKKFWRGGGYADLSEQEMTFWVSHQWQSFEKFLMSEGPFGNPFSIPNFAFQKTFHCDFYFAYFGLDGDLRSVFLMQESVLDRGVWYFCVNEEHLRQLETALSQPSRSLVRTAKECATRYRLDNDDTAEYQAAVAAWLTVCEMLEKNPVSFAQRGAVGFSQELFLILEKIYREDQEDALNDLLITSSTAGKA